MMKLKINPKSHSVGNFIQMLPRQSVPMRTKKKTPVGIEINSVVNMNGPPKVGAQPEVNMW